MKRLAFLDPFAWVSALLLLGLWYAFGVFASFVVPRLLDLFERSPRVAMIGFLLLIMSPGIAAAIMHRASNRTIDRVDRSAREGAAKSVWAGTFAWLCLFGTDLLATFVMLVLSPPDPDQMHLAAVVRVALLGEGSLFVTRTAVWLAIAACFFALERRHAACRTTPSG